MDIIFIFDILNGFVICSKILALIMPRKKRIYIILSEIISEFKLVEHLEYMLLPCNFWKLLAALSGTNNLKIGNYIGFIGVKLDLSDKVPMHLNTN